MKLPKGTTIAVADGEKLMLFRNSGDEAVLKLSAVTASEVDADKKGSGARHQSSSANPDDSQQAEDGFAAGVANMLNTQVLDGKIEHLVVIAAPRTLGELRKHFHQKLSAILLGEIAKDLTGRSMHDIEKAVASA